MKVLAEGTYFVKEVFNRGTPEEYTGIRLWHDCKKYKDRDSARVEMRGGERNFTCPHCGFKYKLSDLDLGRINATPGTSTYSVS